MKSFSLAVKRLEEVSVSSRGGERVQLLRRWLVALREIERMTSSENVEDQNQPSSEEAKDSPKTITTVSDSIPRCLWFIVAFTYDRCL